MAKSGIIRRDSRAIFYARKLGSRLLRVDRADAFGETATTPRAHDISEIESSVGVRDSVVDAG